MATTVTVKGQVTLPKAVRQAAGIRPGDRVVVRARPEGGVVVEREVSSGASESYRERLDDIARKRPFAKGPFRGARTDAVMRLLRGGD